MDKEPLESLRQQLLARDQELRDLDARSSDSRAPVELDQSRVGRLSRMDALRQGQHRRRQGEQQRIKAALARMASDDYGWCLSCDEEISPARLQADAAAPQCVHCAGRR